MPKGLVAGIAATACWGLSTVLTKGLLTHFHPLLLLMIQLLSSSAFLWVVLFWRRTPMLPLNRAFSFSLPGLLQPGLAFVFGILGLCLTSASSESLIWATESILVVALAWWILREQISTRLLFLAAIAMCGTVLATAPSTDSKVALSWMLGNAFIFGGVCCAALYTIVTRYQLDKLEPLYLTALHQLSGLSFVAFLWCLSLFSGKGVDGRS